MKKAAHRHWNSAEKLPASERGVAGYLYGLAAECAVKELMQEEGFSSCKVHFPYLQVVLDDQMKGRTSSRLRPFATQSFMREWAIEMRYSDGSEMTAPRVQRWRKDAEAACAEL